jgi:hypothetical protein
MQRARPPQATPGVNLDALSDAQLERLHAGFVKLASMDDAVLGALVEQVLADDELASSSWFSRVNKKTADPEWRPGKRGTPAQEKFASFRREPDLSQRVVTGTPGGTGGAPAEVPPWRSRKRRRTTTASGSPGSVEAGLVVSRRVPRRACRRARRP